MVLFPHMRGSLSCTHCTDTDNQKKLTNCGGEDPLGSVKLMMEDGVMPAHASGMQILSDMPLLNRLQAQQFENFNQGNTLFSLDNLFLLVGIIILIALIPLVTRLFASLNLLVERWCHKNLQVVRIQSLELAVPHRLTNTLIVMVKYLKFLILFLIGFGIFTLAFSIFPGTQGIVLSLFDKFINVLENFWAGVVAFVPNLIALLAIAFLTVMVLKILRFLSDGFHQGKVKFSGVHPELIDPTFQIIRFLVVAFALFASYPYIPGSSSPVFRGISIFIGFLLSLGSTSLVANIIAGVVLTYTRGLRIGDRVEIADAVGDVVDRNLLVTRIRTIKNVVITIPNGTVLNNYIINYSASAKGRGLILNTTVTIGYDVPWKQVHQLLIDAANATPDVLEKPKPFVLQTSLDNYYVSYELNAYTRKPARMANIYSELHQRIQDSFNEAGVEIMSPAYSALRDGSRSTVPPQPIGYIADVFRTFSPEDTRPIS